MKKQLYLKFQNTFLNKLQTFMLIVTVYSKNYTHTLHNKTCYKKHGFSTSMVIGVELKLCTKVSRHSDLGQKSKMLKV